MSSHRMTIAAATATMLAAISLYPLFLGTEWFWAGAGATITVAGVGTLTRLRRLPVLACLAAGAAGLLLYLNLVFEARASFGGVLPTLRSLHQLGLLVHTGTTEAARYAPPAPEMSGLVLLAAGGIGIVALLADLTAVRLRSAALAGIPLLLLITEPFTVSASRSWVGTVIAFCLGACGYLAILGTDSRQRIREWEQPRPDAAGTPDTSALTATGRRVGLTALVIALFLPLFIPGLHTTRLLGGQPGIGGHGGGGSGDSGAGGIPPPETTMSQELQSRQPQPVLQYRTLNAPAAVPEYLQLYALDSLTDSGWQLASTPSVGLTPIGGLPSPPGVPDGALSVSSLAGDWRLVDTLVQVSPRIDPVTVVNGRTAAVLPVPYPAVKVVAPSGSWQASTTDLMVYSDDTQADGLHYSVTSADLQATPAVSSALEAAGPPPAGIARTYTALPASYRSATSLASLARQVTAGKSTEFDKAQALQSWLSDSANFGYTLKAPSVTTVAGLESFLTTTRRGYCQQFAVAMAVLARRLGIPARVAIGYTSGTQLPDGFWNVTTHDAHEWPELYFTGYGWLRFEPTPSGPAGQGSATAPSYTRQPASHATGGPLPPSFSSPSGAASARPNQHARQPGEIIGNTTPSGARAHAKGGGLSPWEILGLAVGGLAVLAVLAPAVARLAIRRRRWGRAARGGDAELAHAAWQELQDDLVDYQAGYSPSESPRALGERVSPLLGPGPAGGVAALERITMAEERARYSARPVAGGSLRRDSAEFRRALAATMPRRSRWQARMLPLSILTPTASSVSQAADAVGSFSPGRLRRRADPRP